VRIKKFIKIIIFYVFLLNLSFLNINSYSDERICENNLIDYIIKFGERNFEYNELRNDAGIHFAYDWNDKNNKIIVKRDKNNYPIIRYSLFDNKNFIPNKTSVLKINNVDLSTINDEDLIKRTYYSGNVNFELNNNKNITIISGKYKFNNFKLSNFEILSIQDIDTTKGILEMSFTSQFTNVRNDLKKDLEDTDLFNDSLHSICNEARKFETWPLESIVFDEYRYDADVREGLKNKELLISEIFQLTIDDHLIRTLRTEKGVGFFRQSFDFRKFPFDKQKLVIRIKSGAGNYINSNLEDSNDIGSLTFITPEPGVFLNLQKFLKPEVNKLKAWKINNNSIEVKSKVLSEDRYDIYGQSIVTRTENVLDIEINIERNFQHYLLKIMLPVFLILCVAWYVLWIPTEKYEARLNTSIIALLALIAYNFVFQDDIPKLEYLTDLDWFILLSYIFCLIPVFLSIGFSKFIATNQKKIMKINKLIKIWGGVLYLILTLQIFYPMI
tara:strand:- start:282 stop:1778 length:1497 start_codon:yes stop_codon:yes gene_type:complete